MKAITFLSLAIFAFHAPQISAGSSVCSSGIYAALAPLDNYPPAVSYCQGQAGKATVTVTVSAAIAKRQPATKTTATTKSTTTTTLKTSTTKTTADAKASSWSSLVQQAKSVIATFCSCAGYPATITTSTTLTPSTTSTPTTSTPSPVSTCRNGASSGQVCQPTPSADQGNYGGNTAECYSDCDDVSNYGQGCVGATVDANNECYFNINCCIQ